MQSETIYLLNSKLYFLESFGSQFKVDLPEDGIKYIKNVEAIGMPFNILTRDIQKSASLSDNSFKYTKTFRELINPIRIMSTIEYYLREAEVNFTLSRREEDITQNMGFTAGKFLNSIVPCQFYLIKDKI